MENNLWRVTWVVYHHSTATEIWVKEVNSLPNATAVVDDGDVGGGHVSLVKSSFNFQQHYLDSVY